MNSMSYEDKCRLFVGGLPTDMNQQEFEEEVQKWGEVVNTYFATNRNWGTVQFRTKEYKDKFLTMKHK